MSIHCPRVYFSALTTSSPAVSSMYEKFVPEDTRRYIDSQMKPAPAAKNRIKRTGKPVPKQEGSHLGETEVETNAQP